ncbi:Aste57867_999 [Aphanomyces stellatus]|uniref:Aste57867_999 protein n=1 Tax=Aphanomyces stellatus TaxID=120398 RepID=A0A485K4E3_9STRA|nr:hypothetical protein As57867_000998 [Aphanomyces stellatus]VFT78221.1 Aste57867_999 [Aphanomyces stellatus]
MTMLPQPPTPGDQGCASTQDLLMAPGLAHATLVTTAHAKKRSETVMIHGDAAAPTMPLSMSNMGSYCCVCSDVSKSPASPLATSTLAAEPPTRIALVRSNHDFDASLPREFEFTAVLPAGFQPRDVFDRVSAPIQQVVLDGFNASMVCYGTSSLKRATTLGMPSHVPLVSSVASPSLIDVLAAYGQIGGILFRVFTQTSARRVHVGLSCWVVHAHAVRDLLRPPPPVNDDDAQAGPFQFATMHVQTLSQALSCLARTQPVDPSAHLFVRVALYSTETQELSLLHFVDLGHLAVDEEREFLGLFDALVDDTTTTTSAPPPPPPTCMLTHFLAPLLAGNSKTYLLGFVDAHVPVATLDLLWIMSGVRLITCACVKLQNIRADQLEFEPFVEAVKTGSGDGASLTQKLFGDKVVSSPPMTTTRRRSSLPASLLGTTETGAPSSPSMDAQPTVIQPTVIQPTPSSSPATRVLGRRLSQLTTSSESTAEWSLPPPPIPLGSPVAADSMPPPLLPSNGDDNDDDTWKTIVQAAHLPCLAPPAPNVDGLDAKNAWIVLQTEAQLLRKHYNDLLHVLQDQHHHKLDLEHQVDDLHLTHQEMEATYHVQMQDLKLANVDLRSKLRVFEAQTGMHTLLEKYEAEIQTVTGELDKVRALNLNLELKLSANASVDLRNRYRDVVKENVALHEEVLALRKKERHFLSSKKVLDESAKKIDALSKLVTTKDDMLMEARLGEARLSAQVDQQEQKSLALKQQQSALAQENEKAAEELVAVKMYLASIQTEQKKAEMLDRFVKKHGSSLLSTDKQKANSSIDEHAKKVLGAIKRAVPQVVPSVHKLIQRLHEQESSLLEYSTREMDLINLLVELATDQQALTLAQVHNTPTTRKASI